MLHLDQTGQEKSKKQKECRKLFESGFHKYTVHRFKLRLKKNKHKDTKIQNRKLKIKNGAMEWGKYFKVLDVSLNLNRLHISTKRGWEIAFIVLHGVT